MAPIFLSQVHKIDRPSTLKLRCVRFPGGGSSAVSFVKLTALKAGSLTVKGL